MIYEEEGKYYYVKSVSERSPLYDTEQQALCAHECEAILLRLNAMHDVQFNWPPDMMRGLQRAIAWLQNVTDPMLPEQNQEWVNRIAQTNAEIELEDMDETKMVRLIGMISSQADRRAELKEYTDQLQPGDDQ